MEITTTDKAITNDITIMKDVKINVDNLITGTVSLPMNPVTTGSDTSRRSHFFTITKNDIESHISNITLKIKTPLGRPANVPVINESDGVAFGILYRMLFNSWLFNSIMTTTTETSTTATTPEAVIFTVSSHDLKHDTFYLSVDDVATLTGIAVTEVPDKMNVDCESIVSSYRSLAPDRKMVIFPNRKSYTTNITTIPFTIRINNVSNNGNYVVIHGEAHSPIDLYCTEIDEHKGKNKGTMIIRSDCDFSLPTTHGSNDTTTATTTNIVTNSGFYFTAINSNAHNGIIVTHSDKSRGKNKGGNDKGSNNYSITHNYIVITDHKSNIRYVGLNEPIATKMKSM